MSPGSRWVLFSLLLFILLTSESQIKTRRQNIRVLYSVRQGPGTAEHPFLADSEEEFRRKMRERDAYKALANSIGMDLDEVSPSMYK